MTLCGLSKYAALQYAVSLYQFHVSNVDCKTMLYNENLSKASS